MPGGMKMAHASSATGEKIGPTEAERDELIAESDTGGRSAGGAVGK